MVSRREMLAGGLMGSFTGTPVDAAEEQEADREGQRAIQRAIESLRSSLDRAFNQASLSVEPISKLRQAFELFGKSNTKFPDFVDVGISVFWDVYDWHVRNRQQILVVRQVDNRYTIQFMFTTLVLRFEHEPNYVGIPYDKA